jgi:hypothetical protein
MHDSMRIWTADVEGELSYLRWAVRNTIAMRFGEETAEEFRGPLERITDMCQLAELRDLAFHDWPLSQFRKAIGFADSGKDSRGNLYPDGSRCAPGERRRSAHRSHGSSGR